MVDDLKKAVEVKEEFMSVVSHELRTPLNGIIGMHVFACRTEMEPALNCQYAPCSLSIHYKTCPELGPAMSI